MFIKLITTFFGWLVLIWASITLIGMFVRGFFVNPDMEKLKIEGSDFIKDEVRKYYSVDRKTTFFSLLFILIYLFVLFYFWGRGVCVIAGAVMVIRIPDLFLEMKHGNATNHIASLGESLYHVISTLMILATLPILWVILNK